MKYLDLSLMLEDILLNQNKSVQLRTLMRTVFYSIEALVVLAPILQICSIYQFWVQSNFKASSPLAFTGQFLEMVISLLCLFILYNAVQRIKKCAVGELAVSKQQMTWHLGSFSMFAFANILWLILQLTDLNQINIRRISGFKVNLSAETLTIICVFMSELPLLHILNSIVAKGI